MIIKWQKDWDYTEKLKDNFLKKRYNTWILNPNNLPEEYYVKPAYNFKGENVNNIKILYPCGRNNGTNHEILYVCQCYCGNYFLSPQSSIRTKRTMSCGCQRDITRKAIADNLIGQTFGDLIVLKDDYSSDRRKWKCQCKCGKITYVSTNDLKSGHTTSCGCNRYTDITNQRFGKLVALYPTEELDCCKSRIWHCLCDCGKTKDISIRSLISKKTQSCGCIHCEDLVGKKFGKLIVVEYSTTKNHVRYWKCKCECGNIIEVSTDNLNTGNTRSCGCIISKGNSAIKKFLLKNKIPFKAEYSFKDCLSELGNPLRFDFCIFNSQKEILFLIEYDGNIHFKYDIGCSWNTKKSYENRILRDKIKDNYCLTNNIKLVRINYKENLQQRLEEIFNEL